MTPCGVAYPQLRIRGSSPHPWPRRWIHEPFRERWAEGAAARSPRRRDDRGGASLSLSFDTPLASDQRALAAGLPRGSGGAVWPLSATQQLWAALLWGGKGAVLAGLTAARLEGLHGFTEPGIHLLLPATTQVRKEPIRGSPRAVVGEPIVVHRSRWLDEADVHPVRQPPRTLVARSLVDAAAWTATDDRARALLAAGVQQRLVRPGDLMAVSRAPDPAAAPPADPGDPGRRGGRCPRPVRARPG